MANSLILNAQINVVPVGSDTAPDQFEGFYYSLPKTLVSVEVWVDETEQLQGPFADYAGRMLGISDVIKNSNRSYVISGINLSIFQEADPAQFYFVRMPLKGGVTLDLVMNHDATLRSLQARETDSKKKASARIANIDPSRSFVDVSLPDVVEKIDTVVSRVTVDTLTFERITFPKTYIEKSPEQKARQAADFILKLEEDRQKLISGFQEVNYSMESIRYMNEQMKVLQNDYLALFKGKSRITTTRLAFVFIPEEGSENKPLTLFRFDRNKGVLDKNSTEGEQVTIQFSSLKLTAGVKIHAPNRKSDKRAAIGLYYRIPEKAAFVIRKGSETLAEKDFLVSQLGVVSSLPARGVSVIEMHPQTGSIMRLKLE